MNTLDSSSFVVIVAANGQCSVLRDQEIIYNNVQLPMEQVEDAVTTYVDAEPCVIIAAGGKAAGVYLLHAVALIKVRSLPYKEDVNCVCVNTTATKIFFGTMSGWIC